MEVGKMENNTDLEFIKMQMDKLKKANGGIVKE